jgi:hypothetical protein
MTHCRRIDILAGDMRFDIQCWTEGSQDNAARHTRFVWNRICGGLGRLNLELEVERALQEPCEMRKTLLRLNRIIASL